MRDKAHIRWNGSGKRLVSGFLFVSVALLILLAVPMAGAQELPIANAGDPNTVYFGEEFSINGSSQGNHPPFSYQWDIDSRDGLWWEGGEGPQYSNQTLKHTYAGSGDDKTYNITLRVTDDNGEIELSFKVIIISP